MASSTRAADPKASGRAADRVLWDATRHSAGRAVALCLLGLAGIGVALLLPYALGRALDLLLTGRPARGWVTVCAALVGTQVLLGAADDVLGAVTAARATAWLRMRLVRHVLDAGPEAARGASATSAVGGGSSGTGTGDLVTRLVGNAADAGAVPPAAAALPAAFALPVGGIVALGLTDPWLAAAFLAGAPPLALLVRRFARSSSDCVARYLEAQGAIAGRLVEALGGARTIAAARTEEREYARVLEPLPGLSAQGHRMWRVQGRATAQAAVLVPLLQIVVLAVGGVRLRQGGISLGELLAATRYASMATGIGLVVGQLSGLVRGRAAARRLAAVLGVPAPRYGERALPPGDGTLELRGVTVARGGVTVLDGLDLTVPGGACVAVVGHSGAGKSVLAALAGRLTDPDAGQVLLDGVPLPELRADALRDAVGYAFERPVLLGDTIGDTLRFGLRPPRPAALTEAARAAGADGFVHLLPDAYDTPRAAAPMSGGEVQRLGLARAFAHAGRLLVLDDATSSLDTVTELRVTQALAQDPRHRTRLVVAHRASTAARADLVAWLTQGHLRALGPHESLWRIPAYREVFAAGGDPAVPAAEGADLHG